MVTDIQWILASRVWGTWDSIDRAFYRYDDCSWGEKTPRSTIGCSNFLVMGTKLHWSGLGQLDLQIVSSLQNPSVKRGNYGGCLLFHMKILESRILFRNSIFFPYKGVISCNTVYIKFETSNWLCCRMSIIFCGFTISLFQAWKSS